MGSRSRTTNSYSPPKIPSAVHVERLVRAAAVGAWIIATTAAEFGGSSVGTAIVRWGCSMTLPIASLRFSSMPPMPRKSIGLRVSEEFLAQLDAVRGLVPRETWIRDALMREVERCLKP